MRKQDKHSHHIGLISFAKFMALMFPPILYLVFILLIYPAPNSGFIALGVLGSFIIGLGLLNVCGLLDGMYLGNVVTIVVILPGTLFVSVSSLIMYTPIYSQLKEEYIAFYFIVWSLLFVCGIYYCFFRHAVKLYLQGMGFSKSKIKEALRGKRNFWWYESLYLSINDKWIYWLNKTFTLVFLPTVILHILLGWWKWMFPVITGLTVLLLIMNLAMYWLIFSTWDFAKSKKKRKTPIERLGGFAFPFAGIIAVTIYLVSIW